MSKVDFMCTEAQCAQLLWQDLLLMSLSRLTLAAIGCFDQLRASKRARTLAGMWSGSQRKLVSSTPTYISRLLYRLSFRHVRCRGIKTLLDYPIDQKKLHGRACYCITCKRLRCRAQAVSRSYNMEWLRNALEVRICLFMLATLPMFAGPAVSLFLKTGAAVSRQ